MMTIWQQFFVFLKEILLFGIDAFMVSATREITRRFLVRLTNRGGLIEEPKQVEQRSSVRSMASGQSALPFLDEYRD
jgi:hypothetical protein